MDVGHGLRLGLPAAPAPTRFGKSRKSREGIGLLESLADVDADAACPSPALVRAGTGDPAGDALVRELCTATWVGGPDFRRRLRLQWRQGAADSQLVAIPVMGGRQARVQRCLALLAACIDVEGLGEPFARARLHMTAGRAELMRHDGVRRRDNVARAAHHFETALEAYVRLRTVSMRSEAETHLGAALLAVDPDPDGSCFVRTLEPLESARRARSRQGGQQPLAVTEASLGEAYYRRLVAFGDPADADAGLAHLETATALFAEVGQRVGQAHFLVFQAWIWAARPDGAAEQNRLTALALLDRAQPLVSRDASPIRWAMVQAETALLQASGHPSGPELDRAVQLARAAAAAPEPHEDPREWANNLGVLALVVAAHAHSTGSPDAADESVAAMREAVPLLTGLVTLPVVAGLHADVARVLRLAAVCTGRFELLEEAVGHVERGLEIARTRRYSRPEALLLAEVELLAEADRRLEAGAMDFQEVLHG